MNGLKLEIISPAEEMTLRFGSLLSVRWVGGDSSWRIEVFVIDSDKWEIVETLTAAPGPNGSCDQCGGFLWFMPCGTGKFQFLITAFANYNNKVLVDWAYSKTMEVQPPTDADKKIGEAFTHMRLHIIAMAARAKRMRTQKQQKRCVPLPKSPLEGIRECGRIGELMQNRGFDRFVDQANLELWSQRCRKELLRKSKEELEAKDPTASFEAMMHDPARIDMVMQTAAFRALVDNASQALMKRKVFKRFAKLKSVEEILAYQEPERRESVAEQNPKNKLEQDDEEEGSEEEEEFDEEGLRDKLLGKPETEKVIFDTTDALERGELVVKNPSPEFFDVLFYLMEKHPHLPRRLQKIEIVMNHDTPWELFEDNIYNMSSVLANLIQEARKLQSLTLQRFEPDVVFDVLKGASLCDKRFLQELNLEDNSLRSTRKVLRVLARCLPVEGTPKRKPQVLLSLKLKNNHLDHPSRIESFFSNWPNLTLEL